MGLRKAKSKMKNLNKLNNNKPETKRKHLNLPHRGGVRSRTATG
jgi:hypothetical protein